MYVTGIDGVDNFFSVTTYIFASYSSYSDC